VPKRGRMCSSAKVILARPILHDRLEDLEPALVRLGLGRSALGELGHAHLLLTGLGAAEIAFLRSEQGGRVHSTVGDLEVRPGSALLSGNRAGLEAWALIARSRSLVELAEAVDRALAADTPPAPTVLGGRRFAWGTRTFLMGVVNVTPDSFSDGGRYATVEAAVAQGEALAKSGADLLDIGGESTRPGAEPVPIQVELERVLPVLDSLRARIDVPLSIDTRKAAVARRALAAGASLVNDVSGLAHDPELAAVVAEGGAALCLMHMQGTPRTMQADPKYDDVVAEVLEGLAASTDRAVAAGVPRSQLWVDPGIGFGKTTGHNLFLLRHLAELRVLRAPVLVGTSRKRFLGALAGGRPPEQRLPGTLASVAAVAVLRGADVVRVHDVAEAKDALAVADAVGRALAGGRLWETPRPREPVGR
jgi:dihydropteroate synthase